MARRKRKRANGQGGILYRKERQQWYLKWTDATGRRRKASAKQKATEYAVRVPDLAILESRTEGQATARAILAEVVRHESEAMAGPTNEALLEDLKTAYLAYQAARNSAGHVERTEQNLRTILDALGVVRVCDVTPTRAENYLAERPRAKVKIENAKTERTVSVKTANMELGALRAMLKWAEVSGRIKSNPIANVKPLPVRPSDITKRRRAMSEKEIGRLLAHSTARWRLVWRTFLATGMRKNELAELTWDAVDFDAGMIHVRPETAKREAERFVPLHPELAEALKAHKAECEVLAAAQRRKLHDRVFTTRTGRSVYGNVLRAFYASLKKAKVSPEGLDVHALRANFITYAIDAGVNAKAVQYMSGHKTLAMTVDTYHKLRPETLLKVASSMPDFGSMGADNDGDGEAENDQKPGPVVPRVVPQGQKAAG